MTRPTAATINFHVRADTAVGASPYADEVGVDIGGWPTTLALLGFREDVEGVLERALAAVRATRPEVAA